MQTKIMPCLFLIKSRTAIRKSHVKAHERMSKDGKMEMVRDYDDSRSKKQAPSNKTWYHGTNKEFSKFKVNKKRGGIYFHSDKGLAGQYGKNIKEAHLDVKKTFDYEDHHHQKMLQEALKSEKGYEPWWEKEAKEGDWEMLEKRSVQKMIRENGFDSYHVNDHPGKALAVISPDQIKTPGTEAADVRPQARQGYPQLRKASQGPTSAARKRKH